MEFKNFKDFHEMNENMLQWGGTYLGKAINTSKRILGSLGSYIGLGGNVNITQNKKINFFNKTDNIVQYMRQDKRTNSFIEICNKIYNSKLSEDDKIIKIIDHIDDHVEYINDFKKRSLKELKEIIIEDKNILLNKLSTHKNFIKLHDDIANDKSIDEKKTLRKLLRLINQYIIRIETTNLGIRRIDSLTDFKANILELKKGYKEAYDKI